MKNSLQEQSNIRKAQLISAKQLAEEVLGVSIRQVWRLNATGKLPRPIRLGGSVKWKTSEITDWFEKNCPDRQTWEAMKEVTK